MVRSLKLTVALIATVAFSTVAVAIASAAETLWRGLPGSAGETFKGGNETGTITAWEGAKGGKPGASLTCTKSELLLVESKLTEPVTDATLAGAEIHISSCTVAGLPINSVGDKPGIVLIHLNLHNCIIKERDFGLVFTPETIILEVPATKLTIVITGSFIGLIEKEKANRYRVAIAQAEGHQTIENVKVV